MTHTGMRKVFIITYYWPPAGGPGVQRVLRFVRYLPEFGWLPVVFTVEKGTYPALDPSLIGQIPRQCRVYTSPIVEPYGLFRRLMGRGQEEAIPNFVMSEVAGAGWAGGLARWIRANLFVPDARVGWLLTGIGPALKALRKEQPEVLFASSPPHTIQLLACRLVKHHPLPWVADLRDPWSEAFWMADAPRCRLIQQLDRHLERTVLQQASAVTTVSPGIARLFERKAPNRYEVIRNGIELLPARPEPIPQFRILFFGHLSELQNPAPLLEAVAGLPEAERRQVEVVFVGRVFPDHFQLFEQFQDRVNIQVKPYMPHARLMAFARQASLLFRPIVQSRYAHANIGAKTYDYLALRKPMLTLGQPGSESERLLRDTASGALFAYTDVPGIARYIRKVFQQWRRNGYVLLDNEARLRPYTIRAQVKKLAGLLDDLAGQKG